MDWPEGPAGAELGGSSESSCPGRAPPGAPLLLTQSSLRPAASLPPTPPVSTGSRLHSPGLSTGYSEAGGGPSLWTGPCKGLVLVLGRRQDQDTARGEVPRALTAIGVVYSVYRYRMLFIKRWRKRET